MLQTLSQAAARGAEVALSAVGKSYGSAALVVDGVNLQVRGGEILALLGPSGCGKTTTLRMIAGLVQPSVGEVRIDGQLMNGLPVHRRNLGMLFQNYALFPHLTVLENVAFGLAMRGVAKAEAHARSLEALQLVRLEALAARMPAALSGGQQQRVALARAIVYQPRLLLLDEPLGALDKKLREAMQIELRQLCNRLGLTTILVTHDQEEALTLADRIAVMRGGRIEQIGAPRDIYERPVNAFVADFIGSSNFVRATVTHRDGDRTRLRAGGGLDMESSTLHQATEGVEVTLGIRPECIRLTPLHAAASAGNTCEGVVTQSVFKGQHLSVSIRTAGDVELLCTVPVEEMGAQTPRVGESWRATWAADRTRVLQD